ncbi:MAG: master DNA invertase Mpi family serine-type recombinase [Proteobacteria bacterium]|nr:master DNA invertase Mpi family serine-type recombinase [Pseudomonadota bacterium]
MSNYGYIRVSTDKQTTENQRYEIIRFAAAQGITINKWIDETISATKPLGKRKLGALLSKLGKGDIIVASEISRLGRNLMQVMTILHHCMNIGARVWTVKDKYRLGDDIQSKVLAFAFGLSAEIERNLISQRTREALARIIAQGKSVGRPKGQKNCKLKLTAQTVSVQKMLAKGKSKSAIARRLKCDRKTLSTFIKKRGLQAEQAQPQQSVIR